MPAKKQRSIKGKIMGSTVLAVAVLVLVSAIIMAVAMTNLTSTILLDNLQPTAHEAAKTVEGNLHLLADRTMAIALDARLTSSTATAAERSTALAEAKERYEFVSLGIYDTGGRLAGGDGDAGQNIAATPLFALLQQTDNLTVADPQTVGDRLAIMMGMPVRQNGKTAYYLVGAYRYDALSDVLSAISVGKTGSAIIINEAGTIVGHRNTEFVRQGLNVYTMDADGTAAAIFDRMITGETGSSTGTVNGASSFVAFSPVRGTEWSLAIAVPRSDYMNLAYAAMAQIIAVATVMLLLALAVMYRLSRKISVSLGGATARIARLSEGDLSSPVTVTQTNDELEQLTSSLRMTVESVNAYLSEIEDVLAHLARGNLDVSADGDFRGDFVVVGESLTHIIASLNRTMREIGAATARLSGTAESLNQQSGELHRASELQSEAVTQLVGEVENVRQSVDSVTSGADETRQRVHSITGKIADGTERMASLLQAIEDINANARDILKVSKMIEDIAMQTNILALNASVEAARAGAAGKGFAVVADEVRSLASKSAEAAKNTGEMLDRSFHMIQQGSELAAQTSGAFEEISGGARVISEVTDALAQAAEAQQGSLGEITRRVGEITDVTQRKLQNAQATAQASGELAQEAEGLRSMVGRFTLKKEVL